VCRRVRRRCNQLYRRVRVRRRNNHPLLSLLLLVAVELAVFFLLALICLGV
jgi:hypothetical protein